MIPPLFRPEQAIPGDTRRYPRIAVAELEDFFDTSCRRTASTLSRVISDALLERTRTIRRTRTQI